jgi:hypothetical protein
MIIKRYFLLFTIGFFLIPFFLKREILAEWKLDLNPPTTSVSITCGFSVINQNQPAECTESSFTLRLTCSDDVEIGSKCDNAYYFIRYQSNNLENNCVLSDYPSSSQGKYEGVSNPFTFQTTIQNNQNFYRICAGSSDLAGNIGMIEAPVYLVNPGSFFKLKDASLDKKGSINLTPPLTILPFDNQDTSERYLIIREAGVVSINGSIDIKFPPNNEFLLSNKNWRISSYNKNVIFGRKFMDYAKSRKMTHNINSIAEIKKEMINIIETDENGELVVDSNLKNFSPAVLIVRKKRGEGFGKIVFRSQSGSKETDQEGIFFYADEIVFNQQITSAIGIFFANRVTFNSSREGFKITGNLISNSEVNIKERRDDYRKPSFFLVFDAKQYLSLLPLISFSKYDWFQIN